MVRVTDIDESLNFWCGLMGLEEATRRDGPDGKFTLIFLLLLKTGRLSKQAARRPLS